MRWIALLRGINISGSKIMKMEALRELCTGLGWEAVQTYIQSGNIVFSSTQTQHEKLEEQLENAIREHFGYEVPAWVFSAEELKSWLAHNPFAADPEKAADRHFFTLLKQPCSDEAFAKLAANAVAPEALAWNGRMVYFYVPANYARSKLSNTFVEQKLKTPATTRNGKTLASLVALAN